VGSACTSPTLSPLAEHPTHPGCAYERHRPEKTVLYRVLQAHWKTFVADIESAAEPAALPAFVVSEMEAFLKCGILAHGLVLVKCRLCGWSRAVAFSCQRRGFCPSCIGRRMCDFAARLADQVMPHVPVRQWVLTVPHGLRAKLAFDPALTTFVFRAFIAAVSAWLRRRARGLGLRGQLKTGAVTVIQRFNSAVDLSVRASTAARTFKKFFCKFLRDAHPDHAGTNPAGAAQEHMHADQASKTSQYRTLALELCKHREELLRQARSWVGPGEAEDLLQTALEKALGNLASFRPDTNMFAWLRRIMSNLMVDEWRRRRRWNVVDLDVIDLVDPVDEPACPWEQLSDADVIRAVPQLPEHLRAVFELAHRGYSYQRIADTLNLHVRTVGTRLLRARRRLRRYLVAGLDQQEGRAANETRLESSLETRPPRPRGVAVTSGHRGAVGHARHAVSPGAGCEDRQQTRHLVHPMVHGVHARRPDRAAAP